MGVRRDVPSAACGCVGSERGTGLGRPGGEPLCHKLLGDVCFFETLLQIDEEVATDARTTGCAHCAGSRRCACTRREPHDRDGVAMAPALSAHAVLEAGEGSLHAAGAGSVPTGLVARVVRERRRSRACESVAPARGADLSQTPVRWFQPSWWRRAPTRASRTSRLARVIASAEIRNPVPGMYGWTGVTNVAAARVLRLIFVRLT